VTKEKAKYSFIKPTLKFSIAGILIPGFTLYAIVGLQIGISFLGIECSRSWELLWLLTAFGAIISPIIFMSIVYKRLKTRYNLDISKLIIFNIIELTFIQCSLGMFFSNSNVLCYGNGGQNGLEYIFTGWLAIPFIIILSLIFDRLRKKRTEEIISNGNSY
jgi:hypothetical protein